LYIPQVLFLKCPNGRLSHKNTSYKIGPDDLLFNLVFFITFEELNLPIHGPMEDAGMLKLYQPGPKPCLYVAPVDHMVGRDPFMRLHPLVSGLQLNSYNPTQVQQAQGFFPFGCADSTASYGRCGSNMYEVNTWLWNFGCCLALLALPGWSDCGLAMRKKIVKRDKAWSRRADGA
jgi:hypothetical protein